MIQKCFVEFIILQNISESLISRYFHTLNLQIRSNFLCKISWKQLLSWQISNQLILSNNLYQIRANSVWRSIPVQGPQCMVLERPLHDITLSTLRNPRRYIFSILKCLLAKKYTLLRVKVKKQQSGINTWYQLIPQYTLLRCVFFPSFITIEEQQEK